MFKGDNRDPTLSSALWVQEALRQGGLVPPLVPIGATYGFSQSPQADLKCLAAVIAQETQKAVSHALNGNGNIPGISPTIGSQEAIHVETARLEALQREIDYFTGLAVVATNGSAPSFPAEGTLEDEVLNSVSNRSQGGQRLPDNSLMRLEELKLLLEV